MLFISTCWGLVTNKIIHDKGYNENWFWWGFFFNIIALIVATLRPNAPKSYYRPNTSHSNTSDEDDDFSQQNVRMASWQCMCGRQNASYTKRCPCGRTRETVTEQLSKRAELSKIARSDNRENTYRASTVSSVKKPGMESPALPRKPAPIWMNLPPVDEADRVVVPTLVKMQEDAEAKPDTNGVTPVWMRSSRSVKTEPNEPIQPFIASPFVPPPIVPVYHETEKAGSEHQDSISPEMMPAPLATQASPVERKPAAVQPEPKPAPWETYATPVEPEPLEVKPELKPAPWETYAMPVEPKPVEVFPEMQAEPLGVHVTPVEPELPVPSEMKPEAWVMPVAPVIPVPEIKPEPKKTADPVPPPKIKLTNDDIKDLLNQAQLLETAEEIYSFLNDRRGDVKTQEFDSLLLELRNCSEVESVYGNSKSTAILHINLYRNTIAFQNEFTSFS